jgi:DNA-directed RNA polymerase subunit RPC12/RpoP
MDVEIICKYCGHRTEKHIYSAASLEGIKCSVCGDKEMSVKDLSKTKIDTYAGAPPFTKSEEDDPEDMRMKGMSWNMGND